MKRGAKPKPTHLKILQGVRKDRINALEPTAPAGTPEAPSGISTAARREWERLVGILSQMGILTAADGPALELYIEAFERWSEAKARIKEFGVIVATEDGGAKTNPCVRIAAEAHTQMLRVLTEFGLTPSSRSRVNAPGAAAKDELAAFLSEQA